MVGKMGKDGPGNIANKNANGIYNDAKPNLVPPSKNKSIYFNFF